MKTLKEQGVLCKCETCLKKGKSITNYSERNVKDSIAKLKKRVHSKLTKLGVRIHEEDKFDLIGVNNAIYSVKAEIDDVFGFQGLGEKNE